MRPVLAALVLVLSACGPAALEPLCAPGESRSCACTSGALGAQVCGDDRQSFEPCVCDGVDGGPELDDAGVDAGELAADASIDAGPADAGADASIDAGVDAAIVITFPDAGAVCNLYTQEGCGTGQTCRRQRLPGMTPATGEPHCETAGPLTESSSGPCRVDGTDLCGRGLFCAAFARCVRYCEPGGAPCPTGLGGSPQICRTDVGPVPYCSAP